MASVRFNLVIAYRAESQNNDSTLRSFVDLTNIGDILQLDCIKFLRLNGLDGGALNMIKENAFAVFDTPPKKGESNIGEKQLFEFPELEYTERTTQRPVFYSQIDAGIEVQRGKGGFDKNGDYIVTQTPDLPYSNVICGRERRFYRNAKRRWI